MAKTNKKNLLPVLMLLLITSPVVLESASIPNYAAAGSESSSTMRLHRIKARKVSPSPSKKEQDADPGFHAAAHEVPSGPNPESN